jgi:hypothetical protein
MEGGYVVWSFQYGIDINQRQVNNLANYILSEDSTNKIKDKK